MTGSLAAIGAGIAVIGAGIGIGNIGAKAMESIASFFLYQLRKRNCSKQNRRYTEIFCVATR